MQTVLLTAVYGAYDTPKDVTGVDARRIMVTDQAETVAAAQAAGWEVYLDPLERLATPMLRAKWWKCRPEAIAPDADVWLWVDASITPYPGYAGRCIEALTDVDVALTPHPWRDCIYDELEASVGLPKYDPDAMRAQCDAYQQMGHPPHWGLFASGALARRNTRTVRELGHMWWRENLDRSWQDQLSLPVMVRNASAIRWAANMPWAQWWGLTDHGVGL